MTLGVNRSFPHSLPFQSNRFRMKLVENRVELVESAHRYGEAVSVAIFPISPILFDG
jgi:hypothetical protein